MIADTDDRQREDHLRLHTLKSNIKVTQSQLDSEGLCANLRVYSTSEPDSGNILMLIDKSVELASWIESELYRIGFCIDNVNCFYLFVTNFLMPES